MKNLVLKTVAITIASIIGFFALLFGVFALFFPRVIADVAAKVGNYSVAVTFYERQYKLTGTATDLADLIETLDEDKDSAKTAEYALVFLSDFKGYDEFIENAGKSRFGSAIAAEEYYYAKLVRTDMSEKNYDTVLVFARKFFAKNGYSQRNPYSVIVSVAVAKRADPVTFITEVRDDIAAKKEGRTADEIERMDFDITELELLINS